jgi:hypothetical protein
MRRKLFRLAAALVLCVSGYGLLTPQIAHAQCGCSCSFVCPNTGNFSCDGCDLRGLIETANRCCQGERSRTRCPVQ